MKMYKYLLFCLSLTLGLISNTYGQQQVISAGGKHSVSSSNTQLTWTLGQTINSGTTSSNSIYLGAVFQTTDQIISVVAGLSEIEQQVHVYPNPTVDYVSIKPSSGPYKGSLLLINTLGRVILEEDEIDFTSGHVIDMYNLAEGGYVLRIKIDKQPLRQYKIIKQ